MRRRKTRAEKQSALEDFTPPSLKEARSLGDVMENYEQYKDYVLNLLVKHIEDNTEPGDEFMLETIFDDFNLYSMDRRVIGAAANRAKTKDIIVKVGERASKIKGHHRLKKAVWRRL